MPAVISTGKQRWRDRNLLVELAAYSNLRPRNHFMKLTLSTVLITGGTSGIGRALAETFYDRGNLVLVTGRRQSLLDQMSDQRPGILGLALDMNDPAAAPHLAAWLRKSAPTLNVVVANAGISRSEDIASDTWTADDATAMVNTNILGVLRTAEAVLPLLKQNRFPTFMATSSALAFIPRADFAAYCASKAFLHSWLQSLRHQLRTFHIEVLELTPPYLQTELTGASQMSDPRAMPLSTYIQQVLQKLEAGDTPNGEVLLDCDLARRWAERDGTFAAIHAAMNPA